MNKKKSKALAFLLAASLLVPSANGIVSAAELEGATGSAVVVQEQAEGITGSDATTGGETTESTTETVSSGNVADLQTAVNKEGVTKVVISKDIDFGTSHITISKPIEIVGNSKEITLSGKYLFEVKSTGVKISNLTMSHSEADKDGGNLINIGSNMETTIDNCNFEGEPVWNLIINTNNTSKLIFTNNNVNMKARAMIVGVTNGSKIVGNTINLQNEKYDDKNRTGVLSVIANATTNKEDVVITGNTFKGANRVIGVDNATISGDALKIKDNKFIDTRFAFETDSRTELNGTPNEKPLKNKGNSYDLSGNYYEYKGKVGPLRIEDASSKGSHFEEEGKVSTELKIDDKTPLNIAVGPYYTTEDASGNLGGAVNIGVATVNGKDYKTLKDAIAALKDGGVMELRQDIELTKTNEILVGKKVTITSAENKDGKKYTIGLNGLNTVCVEEKGHLILENLNLKLMKSNQTYIQNKGAILEMNSCDVTANDGVQSKGNLIAGWDISDDINKNSKVLLNGNDIKIHVRGIVSNVGNGSKITNNKFDLCGEKFIYTDSQGKEQIERTGILTIVGDGADQIIIKENDFLNANRGIGLDHATISGDKLIIKKNAFENVRFGAEIDPVKKNKDKKYDFSGNYFYHKEAGGVGPMKIQDASRDKKDAQGNPIYNKFSYRNDDGKSVEIKFDEYTDQNLSENINQWPYYTDSKLEHLSNEPGKPIKPVYDHTSIIGSDRYDTAAKIADKLGSYDTVVLVNATSTMSDGLSASGLAGKENGAILLTKKDSIPKVTMDRIKKVKKVYIIGGENAISAKVANEITAANIKVERLGGKTRVETSEIVAKKLGNYSDAFVVNGFKGEADAMSASAIAAKNKAPILLTNGKTSAHAKKAGVKYYVIGGKSVVDKSIASKYNAKVLAGDDRYETNREVMDEFYSGKEKVYIANGDKLVDALTASPLAKNNGIVLVNKKSDNSILKGKDTVQVGGMDFEIKFDK